ncbi:B-box zinc finger protein 21 [Nymphaea thermarum]|nr:B-box zinc finger protein 21 [Nymphaea thermarum]
MKIQCDVCSKEEASLFCCADEAALCKACDQRVHHANKLAGKHQRLPLHLPPSSKQSPLCDICKEKRAFLFCQEDRAILCRDCDIPIHTANELTAKHNRFLLTGIKLLAPSDTEPSVVESVVKPTIVPKVAAAPPVKALQSPAPASGNGNEKNEIGCTTSISDYLIKTIPGWHVEDFLDTVGTGFTDSIDLPSVDGLCKTEEMLKYMEPNFSGDFGYGGPLLHNQVFQVPDIPVPAQSLNELMNCYRRGMNVKPSNNLRDVDLLKAQMLYNDDGFTVPQISRPGKRGRWC